jgi:hypothetical protein
MTSYAHMPEADGSAASRDSLTIEGLKMLDYWPTTINNGHAEFVNPGVHCFGNLNNLDRLKDNMDAAWPAYYPMNDDIFLDYCRMRVRNPSYKVNNYNILT